MLIGNMPLTESIHQLGSDLRQSISNMVDRMLGKTPEEGVSGEGESTEPEKGKPSVFDRDGDGDRDGSWQDQNQSGHQ